MAADTDSVLVAYVHGTDVAYSWHASLMNMLLYDVGNHGRLAAGGYLAVRYGTGGIADARNKAAAQFLETGHQWMFWIDTDMGFAPDTVDRLIDAADPEERPVVGGLCFAQREMMVDDMGGFVTIPQPTIYDWLKADNGEQGFVPRMNYQRDQLVGAAGTGSACLLIHRSVFERLERDAWYSPLWNGKQVLSEDLSFCVRLAQADIPLWIHTGVKTTHLKPNWVSEAVFDVHRDNAGHGMRVPVPDGANLPSEPDQIQQVSPTVGLNRAQRRKRR